MTKEEFIATRFTSQLRLAKQEALIDRIQEEARIRLNRELEGPREALEQLREADQREHADCIAAADFLPFKAHDFITRGDGVYYEVETPRLSFESVSPDILEPSSSFIRVHFQGYAIRKSGTLAQYSSTFSNISLSNMGGFRKAEMSEHICLRRAVKQRMRRRLEGGD